MAFPYKKICFDLVSGLQPRTKDVMLKRFGLEGTDPQTLEAIGTIHEITRERVRQIVEDGISQIKEILNQPKHKTTLAPVFGHFSDVLEKAGHVKREDLLAELLQARDAINHVIFLLTIGDQFHHQRETEDLHAFWASKKEMFDLIPLLAEELITHFEGQKKPLHHDEVRQAYQNKIQDKDLADLYPDLFSLLEISKHIVQGHDGRWGLKWWAEVNPKGIRDKAYLVLKNAGKPLHFLEVTELIKKFQDILPGKKKQVLSQTVHNELIKDPRFVLVGRGKYALAEWGYKQGTVRDVVVGILKENGSALSKEEIVKKALEQRSVKETTILLNLQDHSLFTKDARGRYSLARRGNH